MDLNSDDMKKLDELISSKGANEILDRINRVNLDRKVPSIPNRRRSKRSSREARLMKIRTKRNEYLANKNLPQFGRVNTTCPRCGSTGLVVDRGRSDGIFWQCENCGWIENFAMPGF